MSWQQELHKVPQTALALVKSLGLETDYIDTDLNLNPTFPVRVPASYLKKIARGNPNDPLLLQILPQKQEQQKVLHYQRDPVGDCAAQKNPALLHKYQYRALLLLTGQCVIHCRYCFRQHYQYDEVNQTQLNQALLKIAADTSLTEIILSGGDPLSLSNRRLAYYLEQLNQISHLRRIRIHSRLPVVLPARIDAGLLHLFKQSRLPIHLVIHSNHPQELDKQTQASLKALRQANVWLFNQAVLLKGINDSSQIQIGLSERLAECQVSPYYLHLLDKVDGAAHFDVDETQALAIMQDLQKQLPGYLIPRLVREIAGLAYKKILF